MRGLRSPLQPNRLVVPSRDKGTDTLAPGDQIERRALRSESVFRG
jgi:hypothetical protein